MGKICLTMYYRSEEEKNRIYDEMRYFGKEPGVNEDTIKYLEEQCVRKERIIAEKAEEIYKQRIKIEKIKKRIVFISIVFVVLSITFCYLGYLYGKHSNNYVKNAIEQNSVQGQSSIEKVYISENVTKYHR